MSSLNDIEKRYLERILGMGSGFVLDYSDATYGAFFDRHKIDIRGSKYKKYGTSKAKKMRAFWEKEPDDLVGKVLAVMLDSYEASCELSGGQVDAPILSRARGIVNRLSGKSSDDGRAETEEAFLDKEFAIPNVQKLPIEPAVIRIIEKRLEETQKALAAGAHLSGVIMCGSILEAVLLGKAQQERRLFNTSKVSPKTGEGKVKQFQEWTLANFIDVASDVGVLKLDVKKFSHGLRDFRNYIHPYQQMISGFTPDEHTAKVCFQVLRAALASVAGDR